MMMMNRFTSEMRKRVQTGKDWQRNLVNFKMFTGLINVLDRQFRLQ